MVGVRYWKSRDRAAAGDAMICFGVLSVEFGSESVGTSLPGSKGIDSVMCRGQTPEKRELRSRISPCGRTRTSATVTPVGQEVAVNRISSKPLVV